MERLLREALKRLCLEFGWSYAVFWRITGFGSSMHLIWEDGYCERKPGVSSFTVSYLLPKEQGVVKSTEKDCLELDCQADDAICVLVDKIMASQVHVVGDGLIGQAASLGKHQWINRYTLDRFGSTSKGFAEMNCQIVAGIQTVVVVPVLPFGVVQLGSTQMVLENIMFVDHVKVLFVKLNCGSRACPSDATGKALREKGQTYSSSSMLISGCRSEDVSTNVDNILPVNANGFCPGLVSPPAPKSSTGSLAAVSSQLNRKTLPSASEMMPSKQAVKITYPLGKPTLQSTGDIFPKLDIECIRQVLPADAGSECQNKPSILNSVILSSHLKVLEDELMLTSSVGALESINNVPTSVEDTKSFPLNLKSKAYNNADKLNNVGSLPCGATECSNSCANLAVSGIPRAFYQRSHTLMNPGISEVSKNGQPFSINKVSHAMSNTGKRQENNDLLEASYILSSESNVLASCSEFLPDILHEYDLSYSNPLWPYQRCENVGYETNDTCPAENSSSMQDRNRNEYKLLHTLKYDTSPLSQDFVSSSDQLCMLGFDYKTYHSNGSLDDVLGHQNSTSSCKLGTDIPKLLTDSDACPIFDPMNDQIPCSGLFSVADSDQLLDAVISKINSGAKQDSDDGVSCKTSLTNNHSSHHAESPNYGQVLSSKQRNDEFIGFPPVPVKTEPACSSYSKSSCSFEKVEEHPKKPGLHMFHISAWVENMQNVKYDCLSDSNSKKVVEVGKLNRKRPRPGESPRPRPKDRQMIQDRIKELRELVPSGAKCSIDALLEKAIKHMFFLQSVTKHADKLKVAGEPNIRNEEGGLLLKDNFEGGATWAFEVGTRPTICPIIVEDLNPPRQMLVEMLCEERGFFLEIADFIRGLGLTILKGVMEARKNKVWARFAVEANRDVTRMEIFLSLVRLLEPTTGSTMAPSAAGNIDMLHTTFHQTSVPARVV